MGMYNEVWYPCPEPECNGMGLMQISQIVMGFGNFRLHDLDTLSELSEDELRELKERVLEDDFSCEDCGHVFNPYTEPLKKRRRDLAAQLFAPPPEGDPDDAPGCY